MRVERFKYAVLSLALVALAGFGVGGANQTKAAAAETEQEQALLYSGFKVKSARTAGQLAQVRELPGNEFTVVKQNGNTYYLYPDKKDNRLYAGDQYAYRAYQQYVKDKKLRAEGVFVRPTHYENKSNPKNVEIWQQWGPFPAWKSEDSR
jgi:hypothetical protein